MTADSETEAEVGIRDVIVSLLSLIFFFKKKTNGFLESRN